MIQYFDPELYSILNIKSPYIPNLDIPKIKIDQEWLASLLLTLGGYMDSLNVIQINLINLEQKNSQSVSNSQYFKKRISDYLKDKGIHPDDEYDSYADKKMQIVQNLNK